MRTVACLIACLLLSAIPPRAVSQPQKKLPAVVHRELAELAKSCKEAGGKPARSPGLLTLADLTGDDLPDFVIDQGSFNCEGAASLFSGSGGSQMAVYVGTPDGQAFMAFSSGHFGVRVDKSAQVARLELLVGGPLCGQKVTPRMSRAEHKGCWRPVVWNERSKKLDYAPLSQIKPVNHGPAPVRLSEATRTS